MLPHAIVAFTEDAGKFALQANAGIGAISTQEQSSGATDGAGVGAGVRHVFAGETDAEVVGAGVGAEVDIPINEEFVGEDVGAEVTGTIDEEVVGAGVGAEVAGLSKADVVGAGVEARVAGASDPDVVGAGEVVPKAHPCRSVRFLPSATPASLMVTRRRLPSTLPAGVHSHGFNFDMHAPKVDTVLEVIDKHDSSLLSRSLQTAKDAKYE